MGERPSTDQSHLTEADSQPIPATLWEGPDQPVDRTGNGMLRVEEWATVATAPQPARRLSPRYPLASRLPPFRHWPLVAVILLVTGTSLWTFNAWRERVQPIINGQAHDALLITAFDSPNPTSNRRLNTQVYLPTANTLQPLIAGIDEIYISPDGHRLLLVQQRTTGDSIDHSLVALASDTFETQWSTLVASQSQADSQRWWTNIRVAMTASHAYVLMQESALTDGGGNRVFEIRRFDLVTGQEEMRWPVQPFAARQSANLFASADGQYLYVSAIGALPLNPYLPGYIRYRLPDMQIDGRHFPLAAGAIGDIFRVRRTPDSRTLYHMVFSTDARHLALRFFDLETGATIPDITLPFDDGADFLAHQMGLSHDGWRLYVLAPTVGQIAMIDLRSRRLESVASLDKRTLAALSSPSRPLWARGPVGEGLRAVLHWLTPTAQAKVYFQSDMQLSPDGRRLYAMATQGQGAAARADGVWAIDTRTWRIMAHWQPTTAPRDLMLSANGGQLFIQDGVSDSANYSGALQALDTTTGQPVLRMPTVASQTIISLSELYRRTYGRSLTLGGDQPTLASRSMPLAALSVSVSPLSAVVDETITLEARFVDPATGQTLLADQSGVRYTPPDTVTAILSNPDGTRLAPVTLTRTGYATYRAATGLTAPGVWSVEVVAESAIQPGQRARVDDAVTVQDALLGNDGRRYRALVRTTPPIPWANQAMTLEIQWVDAVTGRLLPATVSLMEPLPDTLPVTLRLGGTGETTSLEVVATAHGKYEGVTTVWAASDWQVQLGLPTGGQTERVAVGVIRVGP